MAAYRSSMNTIELLEEQSTLLTERLTLNRETINELLKRIALLMEENDRISVQRSDIRNSLMALRTFSGQDGADTGNVEAKQHEGDR